MTKTYIGIDNGVSGTIGIISEDNVLFCKTPVVKVQDYTKKKKMVSRLNANAFHALLMNFNPLETFILMERPLCNPRLFAATESALRCHEAMLIVIELLKIPYQFCDSKEWQKVMLPKGYGVGETKIASLEIGNRLFPQYTDFKHPDRDGILMAEYARRAKL